MTTLLLFAHTFWEDSKANRALLESAKNLQGLEIHNLSTAYKSASIDVDSEIARLERASRIFFQFPLLWFSTPSVMKEWQDRVLTHILPGEKPDLLRDKSFGVITTAAGDRASYDGHHGYTLDSLLSPLHASFGYLGCEIVEPFCIFSVDCENLPLAAYHARLMGQEGAKA